nr:MAG TPA: hypothetical protein [Caudoviricetes sp.]
MCFIASKCGFLNFGEFLQFFHENLLSKVAISVAFLL